MKEPRVVTVIQARRGSSRLPGKVLLPLAGRPVLEVMLARVCRARLAGTVVVATTTAPEDDAIAELATRVGVAAVRGHPTDLLDRHRQAAHSAGAEHVVKIPSDCPLIDPDVIDRVLEAYLAARGAVDYASNLHPGSWPDGNDVEVFSAAALESAWREAGRPHEREHTTPWLWDHPGRFRLLNVAWERGLDLSRSHRYVLDYPEDYAVLQRIAEAFAGSGQFTVSAIVEWLDRHPEVTRLNARYRGVNWYRDHLGQLATIGPDDTAFPAVEDA